MENQSKIRSVSLVYDRLSENLDKDVISSKKFFNELLQNVLRTYDISADATMVKTTFEEHPISGSIAVPIGLVINEVLTRIFKYLKMNKANDASICMGFSKSKGGSYEFAIAGSGVNIFRRLDMNSKTDFGLQMVYGLVGQINGVICLDETTETLKICY